MESAAILEFCTNAPTQNYHITKIVCDDDNNMRKHLKYRSDKNKKGKLPEYIPEPIFLADPTHRVKTIAKYIFQLAKMPLSESPVTKDLALQMKKYFGYFLKQQRFSTLDQIRHASKAPLHHLFNNHQFCNVSWCLAKRAEENGDNYVNRDAPFLDMKDKKGAKIFSQLKEVCDRFTTDAKLSESLHYGDTQANESFNNQLAYLAPKNVNYLQSKSLYFRLAIAILLNNEGHGEAWKSIFKSVGINLQPKILEHLQIRDKRKEKKKEVMQTSEYKRKRQHRSNAKILERIYGERRIIQNNLGDYGAGIGESGDENKESPRWRKRRKESNKKTEKCCKCGALDHQRTSYKNCPLNKKNREKVNCTTYQKGNSMMKKDDFIYRIDSDNEVSNKETRTDDQVDFLDNKVGNKKSYLEHECEQMDYNVSDVSNLRTMIYCQEINDL